MRLKHLLKTWYHIVILLQSIPINGISFIGIQKIFQSIKAKGFSFKCTKCGKCCYGPGNVYFTKNDLKNIKKYLRLDSQEWQTILKKIIHKNENGLFIHHSYNKCFFLNEKNQCKIYPVRPLQCRTFPFWPSNFLNKKNLDNLIHQCPGSNLIYEFEKAKYNKKPYSSFFFLEEVVFRCNSTIKKFNRFQINKKSLIKL